MEKQKVQMARCVFCNVVGPEMIIIQHIRGIHLDPKDGSDTPQSCQASNINNSKGKVQGNEWSEAATKFMSYKYKQYLKSVGPMKKFKRKKDMWQQISQDLRSVLNMRKSALQCENRYKTVLKRKEKAIDNNNRTRTEREEIPYDPSLLKVVLQIHEQREAGRERRHKERLQFMKDIMKEYFKRPE